MTPSRNFKQAFKLNITPLWVIPLVAVAANAYFTFIQKAGKEPLSWLSVIGFSAGCIVIHVGVQLVVWFVKGRLVLSVSESGFRIEESSTDICRKFDFSDINRMEVMHKGNSSYLFIHAKAGSPMKVFDLVSSKKVRSKLPKADMVIDLGAFTDGRLIPSELAKLAPSKIKT